MNAPLSFRDGGPLFRSIPQSSPLETNQEVNTLSRRINQSLNMLLGLGLLIGCAGVQRGAAHEHHEDQHSVIRFEQPKPKEKMREMVNEIRMSINTLKDAEDFPEINQETLSQFEKKVKEFEELASEVFDFSEFATSESSTLQEVTDDMCKGTFHPTFNSIENVQIVDSDINFNLQILKSNYRTMALEQEIDQTANAERLDEMEHLLTQALEMKQQLFEGLLDPAHWERMNKKHEAHKEYLKTPQSIRDSALDLQLKLSFLRNHPRFAEFDQEKFRVFGASLSQFTIRHCELFGIPLERSDSNVIGKPPIQGKFEKDSFELEWLMVGIHFFLESSRQKIIELAEDQGKTTDNDVKSLEQIKSHWNMMSTNKHFMIVLQQCVDEISRNGQ